MSVSEGYADLRLDTFETRLTMYGCESQPDGISVSSSPSKIAEPAPSAGAVDVSGESVSLGDHAESVVAKFGDPVRITRSQYSSTTVSTGADFFWTFDKILNMTQSYSCLIYFRNQRVTAYEKCPASRIDFALGSDTADAIPNARVEFKDAPQEVLEKWGMPALVSLSASGDATWDYSNLTVSSYTCTLKFRSGELQSYEGGCRLPWVAHWTF